MADAQMAQETVRERLLPFLEEIEPVKGLIPKAREEKSNVLVKFASMKLYVRGSNSRAKLQSTPVKWLLLDEVRNYRKGALELVLKRTRSFRRSKTVIITTALNEGDASHRAWQDGTKSLLYWECPHCGYPQPFRFDRDESPIYGPARQKGGFRWDENEETRPGGQWDYQKLVKTIWYECEKCGGRIVESQKYDLLANVRRVDLNPRPSPGCVSIHAWVAYTSWVPWADIAVEYLKAMEAAKLGDFEPLKAFVRETKGEPWRLRGVKADRMELDRRRANYGRMELVPEPKASRILTADVQKEALVIKYVYRQWFPNGDSRLIDYGLFQDQQITGADGLHSLSAYEQLRAYQVTHKIKDRAVWIDTGHRTVETYRACLRYRWIATKGDKGEGYSIQDPETKKPINVPYRVSRCDPFMGTNMAGQTQMDLVRFSSNAYKDRLYSFIIRGLGCAWQIFRDVGEDYLAELTADESHVAAGRRVWIEVGTNDYGDGELLQLLAADLSRITKAEILKEVEPEKETKP